MAGLAKVYGINEDSEMQNVYDATWKEFKAFIENKLKKIKMFVDENSDSEYAKEFLIKKERSWKTFLELVDDPRDELSMSYIKYYLDEEYINEQTSIYYKKTWITCIITGAGKFFNINPKTRRIVRTEVLEKELNLPKYQQISMFDF